MNILNTYLFNFTLRIMIIESLKVLFYFFRLRRRSNESSNILHQIEKWWCYCRKQWGWQTIPYIYHGVGFPLLPPHLIQPHNSDRSRKQPILNIIDLFISSDISFSMIHRTPKWLFKRRFFVKRIYYNGGKGRANMKKP